MKKLKKIIKILFNIKDKQIELSSSELIQMERVKPWFKVNGDKNLRINYELNENSIVFDLGGYKGEFASDIFCKYDCKIYIFEPIKEFYDIIAERFSNNKKIRVFHFGLSSKDEIANISLTDNSSSVFIESENAQNIELQSITNFLNENFITHVDLIKINIEGGEYQVLESLIENNAISIFKNIQVQFHDFIIPNAKARMNGIQNKLAKTHSLTYQFEFVWENWKIK
jgi:FkbM family methyltransferase